MKTETPFLGCKDGIPQKVLFKMTFTFKKIEVLFPQLETILKVLVINEV